MASALVQIGPQAQQIDFAYHFVAPRAKLNLQKVSHFRARLRAEAAKAGLSAVAVQRQAS